MVPNRSCGNGLLQKSEQCDEMGEYCCTVDCQFNIRNDFKDPCINYALEKLAHNPDASAFLMLRFIFQFHGATIERIIDDILFAYIFFWLVIYTNRKKSGTSILGLVINLVSFFFVIASVQGYLIPVIYVIRNF